MNYRLLQGDVLDVASGLPDNTYSAVFCDPPYGIKFMNKRWDHGVPSVAVWEQVYRVCKPGAVLMAFGGTRTWHRLAVNIEDAGWQMFDTIMYVYGSGFPKSANISKLIDAAAGAEREVVGVRHDAAKLNRPGNHQYHEGYQRPWREDPQKWEEKKYITAPATPAAATWDGYGTALKPAYEPVLCFRKPLESTYAHSALTYGTGAINVDGCRVAHDEDCNLMKAQTDKDSMTGRGKVQQGGRHRDVLELKPSGRWPANLIHSGDPEVMEVFDRAGVRTSKRNSISDMRSQVNGSVALHDTKSLGRRDPENSYSDTGSAARFFYCAKASTSERSAGLDSNNPHPTLKPLSLCEYLARLIVPPEAYRDGAQILIPYAGVGSEAIGAAKAGWRNITGIELDAEYCEINQRRFDHWQGVTK